MTTATEKDRIKSKEERIKITGLGNVVVIRDSDATRVEVSSEKIRTLLSTFLDVNSKGILLERDGSGWLMHRGGLTNKQVALKRGGWGAKPIVFAVDRSIRPRSNI